MTIPSPLGSPIVNPRNVALLNRAPYLTVSEYNAAPIALDTSQLATNGNEQQEVQALAQVIARASSWIDQYCFPRGSGGTLAASLDTDTGRVRVRRDGYVALPCRFKPVLELDAVSLGVRPSQLGPITVPADVWFRGKVIYVPVYGTNPSGVTFGSGWSAWGAGDRLFAAWSYVDGYPHTTLATTAVEGATSLEVAAVLGVYPGTTLTVYDTVAGEETVVVASATTTGAVTIVELEAPTQVAHTVPAGPDAISVSALPPAVKQAAILMTSALIKVRGDTSLELADMSEPTQFVKNSSAPSDVGIASELLDPFRVVT